MCIPAALENVTLKDLCDVSGDWNWSMLSWLPANVQLKIAAVLPLYQIMVMTLLLQPQMKKAIFPSVGCTRIWSVLLMVWNVRIGVLSGSY